MIFILAYRRYVLVLARYVSRRRKLSSPPDVTHTLRRRPPPTLDGQHSSLHVYFDSPAHPSTSGGAGVVTLATGAPRLIASVCEAPHCSVRVSFDTFLYGAHSLMLCLSLLDHGGSSVDSVQK